MAPDDDDSEDLYDDEFDFVDDDDDDDDASDLDDDDAEDDSELDSALGSPGEVAAEVADSELDAPPAPREAAAKRPARATRDNDGDGDRGRDDADRDGADRDSDRFDDERGDDRAGDDEPVDEYVAPLPAANFRVHIYEHRQFKRTIDRPFTAEDAEAFASEFNRTSKSYGRFALAGKEDAKPRKMLDD